MWMLRIRTYTSIHIQSAITSSTSLSSFLLPAVPIASSMTVVLMVHVIEHVTELTNHLCRFLETRAPCARITLIFDDAALMEETRSTIRPPNVAASNR